MVGASTAVLQGARHAHDQHYFAERRDLRPHHDPPVNRIEESVNPINGPVIVGLLLTIVMLVAVIIAQAQELHRVRCARRYQYARARVLAMKLAAVEAKRGVR